MNEAKSPENQKKQASHFMAFYIIALFSIALVLILLSYMTQVRADDQVAHAETQLQEQVSATQGIQAKMEVLQEASNEQAQRIAALEKELDEAEEESESLKKRLEAQTMLLKAVDFSRSEETWPQMQTEIDALVRLYTLEALDGSAPDKLLWSAEDAKIFNQIRALNTEKP